MRSAQVFHRMQQGVIALVAVALLAGMLPRATFAEASGGSYESPTYGFSLTWNNTLWTAKESNTTNDAEGVDLFDQYSLVYVTGFAWPDVDADACGEYVKTNWSETEKTTSFTAAPREIALPDSPLGGDQALYAMTIDPGTEAPTDLYLYAECLPIQDAQAALTIVMIASVDSYDQEIGRWEDVLAAIDPGSAVAGDDQTDSTANTGEAADEAGPAAGVYENPRGFSLAYDDAVWTATPIDSEAGTGVELEDQLALAFFKALDANGSTVASCPGDYAYEIESGSSFKQVHKADATLERPELADGAVGELYTALFSDSISKYAIYVECREIEPGTLLVISFFVDTADYATELPALQNLLDAVQIGNVDAAGASHGAPSHDPLPPSIAHDLASLLSSAESIAR